MSSLLCEYIASLLRRTLGPCPAGAAVRCKWRPLGVHRRQTGRDGAGWVLLVPARRGTSLSSSAREARRASATREGAGPAHHSHHANTSPVRARQTISSMVGLPWLSRAPWSAFHIRGASSCRTITRLVPAPDWPTPCFSSLWRDQLGEGSCRPYWTTINVRSTIRYRGHIRPPKGRLAFS